MNCPITKPSRPASQTLRLEVHRHKNGSRKAVASEMKSRLLASPMRSLRCRSYSKKYGAMLTRAINAIQKNRLLAKMMNHGQLPRSEEHTSELQSLRHLVCRLLLEK